MRIGIGDTIAVADKISEMEATLHDPPNDLVVDAILPFVELLLLMLELVRLGHMRSLVADWMHKRDECHSGALLRMERVLSRRISEKCQFIYESIFRRVKAIPIHFDLCSMNEHQLDAIYLLFS